MTYEIYRYIFIGAAALAGIALVVSIILFILLNIPKVISDLSGLTAKRAIKDIRENNEKTGDKSYKVSAFNESRGKLTDKISQSGNIIKQYQSQMRLGIDTTKISTQQLTPEEISPETTVLSQAAETTVLSSTSETTVLNQTVASGFEETEMLSNTTDDKKDNAPFGETAELDAISDSNQIFTIEYEITFIHTDEIITQEVLG